MVNQLRGDQNLFLKAKWEANTDKTIKRNCMRNAVEDMNRRKASDLQARKARLAELLQAEDRMYEREFMENLETPEQVRQKMAERLAQLKQQREQERQEQVQHALERKFKMETDELRKEETQFMLAGCQLEREKQLMDKKARLQNQIVEEQVYAKLWMLDADKKAQREFLESQQQKKKVQETVNILTWQTQERAQKSHFDK